MSPSIFVVLIYESSSARHVQPDRAVVSSAHDTPQTPNPKPQTLNPQPSTPNPIPQNLDRKPQTLTQVSSANADVFALRQTGARVRTPPGHDACVILCLFLVQMKRCVESRSPILHSLDAGLVSERGRICARSSHLLARTGPPVIPFCV